jgi:hypothetical protein
MDTTDVLKFIQKIDDLLTILEEPGMITVFKKNQEFYSYKSSEIKSLLVELKNSTEKVEKIKEKITVLEFILRENWRMDLHKAQRAKEEACKPIL